MTEDTNPRTTDESAAPSSAVRQRKKRKWDQPAENFILPGAANPLIPIDMGLVCGLTIPGVVTPSGSLLTQPLPAVLVSSAQQMSPALPHNAAAIVQKLIQPKIQDELLIAREIVINDADPTVRYKLTKRQTQEEIQMCTGAVVITRGKYRPPNTLPDNEKPLYLHISAGTHLKDTAERIKAVDRAAAMVEEIMKQVQNSQGACTVPHALVSNGQSLCTSVYLGFDCDPSVNIADRIRGSNDQYVNHIMNETGATVVLRGHGSGDLDSSHSEALQPMHLYISSTNQKSLEHARILAENLLDTIAVECGTSRISSSRTYSAVPPPQQLLASSGESSASTVNVNHVSNGSGTAAQSFAPNGFILPTTATVCPPGPIIQPGSALSYPTNLATAAPAITGGACYDGYGGIYPQATPLQQVALALKQAPATASVVSSATSGASMISKAQSNSSVEIDKVPRQRRKFQELPISLKGPAIFHENSQQGSVLMPSSENPGRLNVSSMPPPKMLVEPGSNLMHPHPKNIPPPPPKFSSPQLLPKSDGKNVVSGSSTSPPQLKMPPSAPKFMSSELHSKVEGKQEEVKKSNSHAVPDTLLKLMEYGDEDDDIDSTEDQPNRNTSQNSAPKPFWAL